jgi:hypothetical protein
MSDYKMFNDEMADDGWLDPDPREQAMIYDDACREIKDLSVRLKRQTAAYEAAIEVIAFAARAVHDNKPKRAASVLLMALGSHAGEEPWDVLLELIRQKPKDLDA